MPALKREFILNLDIYDNSDPNAKTLESDILQKRGIGIGTLNKELPRSLYKRNQFNEITGITLRPPATATAQAAPMPSNADNKKSNSDAANATSETSETSEANEGVTEQATEEIASEIGQSIEFVESLKRKGRPKKPVDRNEVIIKQYETFIQMKQNIDNYVDTLEDLLPKVPETPGKPKRKFTDGFKRDLFQKHYGNATEVRCPCCQLRQISIDSYDASHIIPESRGGSSDMTNIMPTCKECNVRTATRHLYWYAWKTYATILFQFN